MAYKHHRGSVRKAFFIDTVFPMVYISMSVTDKPKKKKNDINDRNSSKCVPLLP